jgi:hypothetical protein
MLILAGIVVAIAAACCAFLKRRLVVFVLIGWGLVEGEVRRLLPGQPATVMLVDDALVLLVYLSFIFWRTGPQRRWQPPFFISLLTFCLLSMLGIFNPNSPGILVGLVGFHSYVWFVPLLWVGFQAFDNWESAREFFWWLCVITIPMTLLAAYQYVHFASLPAALAPVKGDILYHTAVGGLENIKQVPSIFVNAEKFSRYCLMTFFLSLGLLVDGRGTAFQKRAVGFAAAASAAGLFLSGRRSPLYFGLFGFAWLMMGFYTNLGLRAAYRWIAVVALAGAAVFFITITQNPNAQYYQQSTASIPDRARFLYDDIVDSYQRSGLIGLGTGTGSQGVAYVPGGDEWLHTSSSSSFGLWAESGLGKIMEELGLVGVAFFALWFLSMSLAWFRNVRKLRGKAPYAVGAALAVYFLLMLAWFAKGHQILGDPITLVQFWFVMGMFFAMPFYLSRRDSNLRRQPLPVSASLGASAVERNHRDTEAQRKQGA